MAYFGPKMTANIFDPILVKMVHFFSKSIHYRLLETIFQSEMAYSGPKMAIFDVTWPFLR